MQLPMCSECVKMLLCICQDVMSVLLLLWGYQGVLNVFECCYMVAKMC